MLHCTNHQSVPQPPLSAATPPRSPARTAAMPHHSDQVRAELAAAVRDGASISAVARAHNTTRKAVRHAYCTLTATGGVAKRKSPGRPPVLSAAAATAAVTMLTSGDYDGAEHVARTLHTLGQITRVVHKTTVIRGARRAAKRAGTPIHAHRGAPRKALTQANKDARIAFAQANQSRCWQRVLFTDRKRFLFRYPGAKVTRVGWVHKGQRREARKVNHPDGVNVYAGMTAQGVTACHFVTGTSK